VLKFKLAMGLALPAFRFDRSDQPHKTYLRVLIVDVTANVLAIVYERITWTMVRPTISFRPDLEQPMRTRRSSWNRLNFETN